MVVERRVVEFLSVYLDEDLEGQSEGRIEGSVT